jgi:protein-S-isoprenylcysteine O-methyltransferase Ste14
MPGLALILWSLYGLLSLLLRVAVQARRTGSSGVNLITRESGAAEWTAGIGFIGALALGVAAPILDLTNLLDPIDGADTAGFHLAGIVLYAIGLLGVVGSQAAMGTAWRIGVDPRERTALVTEGPFAVVRNPIFTMMSLTVIGLALLVPSAVAFASVVVLVIALELQTRVVEEPHLLRTHGEAYASYARRVGRFLPGLGRLHQR